MNSNRRRNQTRAWVEVPVADNGEAIVAAMAAAGVEFVFFTSGSEIGFYQEAIAKAEAQGRKAPKLISVTHEHASLNAALGCAAVSGKPVATAAHVDCGTQHHGGAVHTAWHAGLPLLITAGIPPTAYPGSVTGAREPEGHLWLQQTFDQNGIVRQYTKWDHLLKAYDNPGLTVSRALQVACTEPRGPVYLSIPREVRWPKPRPHDSRPLTNSESDVRPRPIPTGYASWLRVSWEPANPFWWSLDPDEIRRRWLHSCACVNSWACPSRFPPSVRISVSR
jgi:acetolactate synthase I/II/III large subunit